MTRILDRFVLKKDDTLPALVRTLKRQTSDGTITVEDLTNASSVAFRYAEQDGELPDTSTVVSRTASVTGDATLGVVTWAPIAADTAAVGVFFAEFVVTFNSGDILTFPNGKGQYIEFCVVQDVG